MCKVEIGDILKDENKNLLIINKYYQYIPRKNQIGEKTNFITYKCLDCNFIFSIRERNLNNKTKCVCCNNKVTVPNVNTINKTHPHLLKYFVDLKDAENNLFGSRTKIKTKCDICGAVRSITINNLVNQGFSCNECGDGISYPEKFMLSILKQLNIEYVYQFSRINMPWCGKYRYDFYIPSLNMIIETHGGQHYKEVSLGNLKEIKNNDIIKKELATKNNISSYVVIDCSYSNEDYIKDNILNSTLAEILDLKKVDWRECGIFATKTMLKNVCDSWNSSEGMNVKTLSFQYGLTRQTITKYLKIGNRLGLCFYDPSLEQKKYFERNKDNYQGKEVFMYSKGIFIGEFKNAKYLESISLDKFGVELKASDIRAVCRGQQKTHRGYTFKYK